MAASGGAQINKVHCNQCRQETNHELLKTVSVSESNDDEGIRWGNIYCMLQCCGCDSVVLRDEFWFSEHEHSKFTFFPPPASRWLPNWHGSLPVSIEGLLKEVYMALQADSLSLAMMGARAIIETAMIAKTSDQGSFTKNLAAMTTAGMLSRTNERFLEVALDAGSASMHRAHRPTAKQMNTVMDIVENFLHSAFVLEETAPVLEAGIPPRPARKKTPPL
jgi:hypothetical protein